MIFFIEVRIVKFHSSFKMKSKTPLKRSLKMYMGEFFIVLEDKIGYLRILVKKENFPLLTFAVNSHRTSRGG